MQFKQVYKFGLVLLMTVLSSVPAYADEADLQFSNVWVREIIPGAMNSAAYMVVENTGTKEAIVTAAYSDIAEVAEVHQHVHENGMMKMRHIKELKIAPGEKITFEPGGYHIMLMALSKHPKVGESVGLFLLTSDGKEWHFDGFVRPLSGHE